MIKTLLLYVLVCVQFAWTIWHTSGPPSKWWCLVCLEVAFTVLVCYVKRGTPDMETTRYVKLSNVGMVSSEIGTLTRESRSENKRVDKEPRNSFF